MPAVEWFFAFFARAYTCWYCVRKRFFRRVCIAPWPDLTTDKYRGCGRAITVAQPGDKTGVILIDFVLTEPGLANSFLVRTPGIRQSKHGELVTLSHIQIFAMNLFKD